MNLKYFFTALVLSSFVSGCATSNRKRNEDEYKLVKKAAIVAFIVKTPASNTVGVSLNTGQAAGMMGGSSFYQKSEDANLLYGDFSAAAAKATGWSVVPLATAVSDPIYNQKQRTAMSIVQLRDLPKAGENWYLIDKLMVPKGMDYMDRDARNLMMSSLGVDALISTEVRIANSSTFAVAGLGAHHPQAFLKMTVYKRDLDEPIWVESIEGPKSEKSTGLTGFMSETEMMKLARESADTAFARIGVDEKDTEKK